MKKYFILILFAGFLLPLASCEQEGGNLKVVSYNIRNSNAVDGENDWELRKEATPAMLEAVDPDVFGVQEALPDQVEYISEHCPAYAGIGVGRDDGVSKGEHMSIFYKKDKFKLLDWGTYWLSETPDVPSIGWDARCRRTATWAFLKQKDNGRKFYFVNTHLDHVGEEARRKGLALIVERIGDMNKHNLPMVLTGDFNVFPDDSCLTELDMMMKSARVFAAVSDTTASFNNWGREAKVIDYIYYKGFSDCLDFRVVTESFAGKPFISDHYPIVSEFIY